MADCGTRWDGFRCIGLRAAGTLNIGSFDHLAPIELRGNGGCGGNGSQGIGFNSGFAAGGNGGNGGGGLYIAASSFSVGALTIDTSGEDGSTGEALFVRGRDGSGTVVGGSGAGGNAGRVILVEDGTPSTIPRIDTFVTAERGLIPSRAADCRGPGGDSNANRAELAVATTQLNCTETP